jgi:hypothetical protein
MPNRKDLILKRLAEEGQKTVAYFRTLSDAEQAQQVYTTGPEWRARDLIAHLVSTERTLVGYARSFLSGGPGVPEDFDIDAYNAEQTAALSANSVPDLLQAFETTRAETLGLAQDMAEADLDRVTFHPWLGHAPLEQILKLLYRHAMLHERDARKAIETGQPVPHVDVTAPSSR